MSLISSFVKSRTSYALGSFRVAPRLVEHRRCMTNIALRVYKYINVNEIATSNSIDSRKVHACVIRLLLYACYCVCCWTYYSIYWTWNWLSFHDVYSRIRVDFELWEMSRRSRVLSVRVFWLSWSRACLERRRIDLESRRARFVNLRLSCSRSISKYLARFLVLSTSK